MLSEHGPLLAVRVETPLYNANSLRANRGPLGYARGRLFD